jgi:BolA family transcriptional regulator, general stress-responsive regulator
LQQEICVTRAERIEDALQKALSPRSLQVEDESHRHAGHAGARPEGETHYKVRIIADAFTGKSRVECHRIINTLLAAEFETGLHALAIEARTP